MKNSFLFLLILILFTLYKGIDNRVFYEGVIGSAFIIILASQYLSKKIHWSARLAFLVFCLSSLYTETFFKNFTISDGNIGATVPNGGSISSLVFLLLGFVFLILTKKNQFKIYENTIALIAILNSIMIVFKGTAYGHEYAYALLSNGSMDASFIACLIPYWLKREISYIPCMVYAILLTHSSTGIAAIILSISCYYLFHKNRKILFGIPILAMFLFSCVHKTGGFLNDNGRFQIWQNFTQLAIDKHPWIGFGNGSFEVIAPVIQIARGETDIFTWMHNDWLQIFFETGLLGLVSFAIFYFFLLKKSFQKGEHYFATVLTLGFVGLTQMPLHLFIFQILGIVLTAEIYCN